MRKLAFYDAKPYDKKFFDEFKDQYNIEIEYHEVKLNKKTAKLAEGCDAVCAFVNDTIDEPTLKVLEKLGIKIIAMRCAGYNNIDFNYAFGKIHVVRVPAYSPYAVAEFAMGMLLTLNRRLHKAYSRTRDFNFSLNGLTGFDLHDKTVGVVGTGKIGQVFIDICKGFGMKILAHDPYPLKDSDLEYVSFDEICKRADVISLHCPLTKDSFHMVNREQIEKMKDGVYIVNTSRGALIDSEALLEGIRSRKIGGAALDVYEEESAVFYEDFSNKIIQDEVLALLLTMPNVLVTSHQAYLTKEALRNIAETTMENLQQYFDGQSLKNEVCYHCSREFVNCQRKNNKPCF